jgi:hypothetical protein
LTLSSRRASARSPRTALVGHPGPPVVGAARHKPRAQGSNSPTGVSNPWQHPLPQRCRDGQLMGNSRGPHRAAKSRRASSFSASTRAEDGIRTRDPHLGNVFEFVQDVQASPPSWPPVYGTSAESGRTKPCCRAVYYEAWRFIPRVSEAELQLAVRSDLHPQDGCQSSNTQCDGQRNEEAHESARADCREKVTQARPGTRPGGERRPMARRERPPRSGCQLSLRDGPSFFYSAGSFFATTN